MASFTNGTKRKKLLHVQAEALVSAIEANPTLVRHAFTGVEGQALKKTLWGAVARDLNKLGPSKTWCQWKQTWKDMKAKTRKLVAMKAREKQVNPQVNIQIPPLERRVLSIILAKDDGDSEITMDLPAVSKYDTIKYEEESGLFDSSQGDDIMYCDLTAPQGPGNGEYSDGASSDQPLSSRRKQPQRPQPRATVDSNMERLLTESNRHMREIVSIGKEVVEVVRDLAEVNRGAVEVNRNIAQALWGIANAIRNSSPGSVLGQMHDDYGENVRS